MVLRFKPVRAVRSGPRERAAQMQMPDHRGEVVAPQVFRDGRPRRPRITGRARLLSECGCQIHRTPVLCTCTGVMPVPWPRTARRRQPCASRHYFGARSSKARRPAWYTATMRSSTASTEASAAVCSGWPARYSTNRWAARWKVNLGPKLGTNRWILELSKTALWDRSPINSSDQPQSGAARGRTQTVYAPAWCPPQELYRRCHRYCPT